tara:strand:+ start:278 stop:1102 length:825 start_codon:yes stop_codon:yes gene_type:complete
MGILRLNNIKHYTGAFADLPATLPYGDTYYAVDGARYFVYSESHLPIEVSSVGIPQASLDAVEIIAKGAQTGYSRTSAFADASVSYTQADVDAELFKVFSLNLASHSAKDNPYWSTPTPSGTTGIGLFQGANLPEGVSSLVDYSYDYDTAYPGSNGTGFEGSTGRLKLNDCKYGDLIKVRFDFNVIPQIANTTVEPALWYSNRNDSDDITFTFPLTAQPIFYGGGTVGKTYLNRVEISAWITSNEDVNALTLPAIKADNPIIIEPIGILITLIR